MRSTGRLIGVGLEGLTAAVVALALLPAAAAATDRYVDSNAVADNGVCSNIATPCKTIAYALSFAGSGDIVRVGGGSYAGNLTLNDGESLVKGFAGATPGDAVIGTTAASAPAITVATGTAPRTINGFTLRGGNTAGQGTILATANVTNLTISTNVFDDASTNVTNQVRFGTASNAGSPRVTGNIFTGVDDNQLRAAIHYSGNGSPEIDHNVITTFFYGIRANGSPAGFFATPNIHDNTVTGIYEDPSMAVPFGILMNDASGQLTANLIKIKPGETQGEGIELNASGPSGTPLQLTRNQVYETPDGYFGISLTNQDPTTLSSDISANNAAALALFSNPAGVTAIGLTATNSTGVVPYDVYVSNTALTLDSSIIGNEGIFLAAGGSCTGSFSRGPAAPGNCGFATAASPLFIDPTLGVNNFHLQNGSPLIEIGNPAAPGAGELDTDGQPRAMDFDADCTARRDIGADEVVPLLVGNCAPPPATPAPPGATSTQPARRVCKKKKKHRSAVAARKCKRKKRR
jgi:hypothetical protein